MNTCSYERGDFVNEKLRVENNDIYNASELFKVLGNPTRLRILSLLLDRELSVNELVESLKLSQSSVSHQLSILKSRYVLKSRRNGKNIYYLFVDEHIKRLYKDGMAHAEEQRLLKINI